MVIVLLYGMKMWAEVLVLPQFTLLPDRQTDRQTEKHFAHV